MDVQQKLDEIVATVSSARSMPMSASCLVNRAELLAMLDQVREALPGSLAQAQELLGDRDQMVAQAQDEAQRIIESAHARRGSLVSETEIARRSQEEADRILAEARQEAGEIRGEADDYVDNKLANFEVVLGKTITAVDRGREKLLGHGDPYGGEDAAGPDGGDHTPARSADPQELRDRADAYVEAQFRAFEAVLSKTLEAVGRGRQKLLGHRPIDELAAHMAAQDGSTGGRDGLPQPSDADYLAGLAAPEQPAAEPYAAAAQYGQGQADRGQVGYAQQDPYTYQQPEYQPHTTQLPAGAETHGGYGAGQDAYGRSGYVGQDTGYGWPVQQGDDLGGSQYPADSQQSPHPHAQFPVTTSGQGVLDETSLFDTSLIDIDQLRRYEQGS